MLPAHIFYLEGDARCNHDKRWAPFKMLTTRLL
jgi:hypothetical protein